MANPADTTYSIIRETVEGTTPATPAFRNLDYIPGNEFKLDSKLLTSDVLKQNRAMAGLAKVNTAPLGDFKTHFRRDTALDLLLESALSGTFSSNVLKGGTTDTFHTIEKKMIEVRPGLHRFTGMIVDKFGLTVDASSNAEATFGFRGMGRSNATAIITGATYAAASQGALLDGTDVGTISIAGLTGTFLSLDLSVESNRESKWALGNAGSVGTGTSGFRTVKLTVKMYRSGLAAYTAAASDAPVAVSFTLGAGAGNAYTVAIPAAIYSAHANDETSGSNAFVTLEFMGSFDATSGTDISITKS
jgi:hypothetical protein